MKRYLSALLALLLALTAAPGLCSEEVTANETGTQLWSPLEAFPDEIVGVCNLISSASSDTYDFLVQDKSRTEEIASAYVRALEESGFYQCVKYKEYTSDRIFVRLLLYIEQTFLSMLYRTNFLKISETVDRNWILYYNTIDQQGIEEHTV